MKRDWWVWGTLLVLVVVIGTSMFFVGRMAAGNNKSSGQKKGPVIEAKKPTPEQKEMQEIQIAASEAEIKEARKERDGWIVRVEQNAGETKLPKLLQQANAFFSGLSRAKLDVAVTSFVAKTSSLKDVWGNTLKDVPLLRVELKKETFDKINWKGFEPTNLPRVADLFWLHDEVKKEMQKTAQNGANQQGSGGGGGSGGSGGGGGGS